MGIARAPDQMRSQSHGRQFSAVRGQDFLLREHLGPLVMVIIMIGVRHGFIHPGLVRAGKDHARRAGVDEPGYAVFQAGMDDGDRAGHIGTVIIRVIAPDPGLAGDVEDRVTAGAGADQGIDIVDVAGLTPGPGMIQPGIVAALQAANGIPAR